MLASVNDEARVVAACFRTDSDHGFILTDLPEAAMPIVADLYRRERPPSLFGRRQQIELLLGKFLLNDVEVEAARHMTYYQLAIPCLVEVRRVFRQASHYDIERLAQWLEAFRLESTPEDPPADWLTHARSGVESGRYFILADGETPLGFIGWNLDVRNPKIAPVYTDPQFRRSGVGAELTSDLIRHIQRLNPATIGLFADVDYEPSNQLYLKLGFQPLAVYTTAFLKLAPLPVNKNVT